MAYLMASLYFIWSRDVEGSGQLCLRRDLMSVLGELVMDEDTAVDECRELLEGGLWSTRPLGEQLVAVVKKTLQTRAQQLTWTLKSPASSS